MSIYKLNTKNLSIIDQITLKFIEKTTKLFEILEPKIVESILQNENKPSFLSQKVFIYEIVKSSEYITMWDNPELWVKLVVLVTALMLILAVLPIVLSPKKTNIEKTTAYECGFAPFFIKEGIIEIQFVVVALLFLIFDLEVVYLVPLALNIGILGTQILSVFLVYVHLAWLMLAIEGFTGALSWPTWLTFEYNVIILDENNKLENNKN